MPNSGFSARVVQKLAGISYRQLDYWARTGLVEPSRALRDCTLGVRGGPVTVTDAPNPGFADVSPSHPFYAPIAWMRAAGVTTGTTLSDGRLGYDSSGAVSRIMQRSPLDPLPRRRPTCRWSFTKRCCAASGRPLRVCISRPSPLWRSTTSPRFRAAPSSRS